MPKCPFFGWFQGCAFVPFLLVLGVRIKVPQTALLQRFRILKHPIYISNNSKKKTESKKTENNQKKISPRYAHGTRVTDTLARANHTSKSHPYFWSTEHVREDGEAMLTGGALVRPR